ncbi:lytic transglycosylase domain-containing protein [Paracoccus sp. p3-h83]
MGFWRVMLGLWLALAGAVQAGDAALCLMAARQAAAQTGVPEDVLLGIALTETGTKREGRFDAWPWTVNMEGKGAWFDSRQAALDFVQQAQARGARSFDIGCFQLNHRWHGQHFASPDAMFDPLAGALYAAQFLSQLYAEAGSWEGAAGLYHSRTPALAEKYAGLFTKHRATAQGRVADGPGLDLPMGGPVRLASVSPADMAVSPRVNDYPLLQRGHVGQMGSLVPMALIGRRGTPLAQGGADASL